MLIEVDEDVSGVTTTRMRTRSQAASQMKESSDGDQANMNSGGDIPTANKDEVEVNPESNKNLSQTFLIRVVQFNVILYSTCFWTQQSCFPYLSKKLGVDNITYGYLQTAFAVAQLAGGPLYGRFGDLMGARAALVLAYSSGVLSYGVLAVAGSIPMLFLSRGLSVFLHCMQGSQMVITDVMPYEKRADAFGKLGLFYGIGMVLGPIIGGQITKTFGEESAALTAAIGSLVSLLIVILYIPRHMKHVKKEDQNVANVFSFAEIAKLMKSKEAAFLLTVKIAVGVPIGVLQSVFSRVAMDTFGLKPNHNGMVMSYIGVVTMLVQGVGVGILLKRFKDLQLMKFSTLIATFAYLLISQVTGIAEFCVAIFPLIVGMTTLQGVIGAAITKAVKPADTGAMLGLSMATNSLIRTVSPTVGAYMLEYWGYSSIGYSGAIICGVVTSVLFRHFKS